MNSPTLQRDEPRRGGGGLTPTEQNVISKHESFKHLKPGIPGSETGHTGLWYGRTGLWYQVFQALKFSCREAGESSTHILPGRTAFPSPACRKIFGTVRILGILHQWKNGLRQLDGAEFLFLQSLNVRSQSRQERTVPFSAQGHSRTVAEIPRCRGRKKEKAFYHLFHKNVT